MEELIELGVGRIPQLIEVAAAIIIAYGVIKASIWLAGFCLVSSSADIIDTAISPSWTTIGQFAAIGTIRTFLDYFLENDIEKFNRRSPNGVSGNG